MYDIITSSNVIMSRTLQQHFYRYDREVERKREREGGREGEREREREEEREGGGERGRERERERKGGGERGRKGDRLIEVKSSLLLHNYCTNSSLCLH